MRILLFPKGERNESPVVGCGRIVDEEELDDMYGCMDYAGQMKRLIGNLTRVRELTEKYSSCRVELKALAARVNEKSLVIIVYLGNVVSIMAGRAQFTQATSRGVR